MVSWDQVLGTQLGCEELLDVEEQKILACLLWKEE